MENPTVFNFGNQSADNKIENIKSKPKSDSQVDIITKIYPSRKLNRMGNYIGKFIIKTDAKIKPANSLDQVDFYLNNISNTYRNEEAEVEKKDLKDQKESIKIIPSYKKTMVFNPIKHSKKSKGGKRKTNRKKRSNKRITRRNNK